MAQCRPRQGQALRQTRASKAQHSVTMAQYLPGPQSALLSHAGSPTGEQLKPPSHNTHSLVSSGDKMQVQSSSGSLGHRKLSLKPGQAVRHAAVPQRYGAHSRISPGWHAPALLQLPRPVATPFVHVAVPLPQTVSAPG